MKRLTKRLEDGQAAMDCDTCSRYGTTCSVLACRNKLKDRLCDYEDVMQSNGLTKKKHGYWMEFNTMMTCSVCDKDWYYDDNNCDEFNYCPNCGADMRDGEGNG